MGESKIRKKANKKTSNKEKAKDNSIFGKLKEGYKVLVVGKVEDIDLKIHDTLKRFLRKKTPGMFVSFSKPYETVKDHLEKEKVDVTKLFVVDAVSDRPESTRESHVFYAGGLGNLTDIGIIIAQFVHGVEKNKFLVIDALNLLLIYHNPNTIAKFVISITSKATKDMSVVFFISEKEGELIKTIYPFFDQVIKGGKTG